MEILEWWPEGQRKKDWNFTIFCAGNLWEWLQNIHIFLGIWPGKPSVLWNVMLLFCTEREIARERERVFLFWYEEMQDSPHTICFHEISYSVSVHQWEGNVCWGKWGCSEVFCKGWCACLISGAGRQLFCGSLQRTESTVSCLSPHCLHKIPLPSRCHQRHGQKVLHLAFTFIARP